ncbi:D-2-hydroxyacid dehydrogenase [Thermosyntropha sp.]|uniref:D-2-hydroxyacid dehydrogenase n=1 Tax=Thermosyntropha sp. TaxID=2740820 RepID=UPI0025D2C0F2|nr:D-2-hydroxyacid dehydrogenase [Thermosyntropha sp.]MBO8158320.1 D-2-hydroxyacid dehydrogenase [Thermosyntropha sp.]
MVRILVTDGMEKSAVESLRKAGFEVVEQHYESDELGEALKNFDIVVVRSATKIRKDHIDKALETGRLKLIIRGGVGVDNIDVAYAMENGIQVLNTPKASSASVAELTIAHMLAVARFLHLSNVTMRQGKWDKKNYKGIELYGKTLGLVGFGRIAREVAKRAKAFGMKVIYTDIRGKIDDAGEYEYRDFEDLLRESDFVSLHCPYNAEYGPIIGKKQLELMKDGAYLVNLARGGVVDEDALIEALESGKLAGACIDVFEEEPTNNSKLVNHPRVSVSPHIGASTAEAQQRIGEEIVDIIMNYQF